MGYPNANMGILLGPDIKIVRSLLGFYIEYLSKYEEKEKVSVQEDLSNVLAIKVQRELQKWKTEPWILSEFLENRRDLYLTKFNLTECEKSHSSLNLIENGSNGIYGILPNSAEFTKIQKVNELTASRLAVGLQEEENLERKNRVSLLQNSFRNYASLQELSGIQRKNQNLPLDMWERKKLAYEKFNQKLQSEDSIFAQKVVLRRKKRIHEKKKKINIEEEKKQENIPENKTEEKKEENKPQEREETPFEAFQRKLENLKIEKEKEISDAQEELKKLDEKKAQLFENEKTINSKYEELKNRKTTLENKNKELQDLAIRKHELTTTLDDQNKYNELVKEEQIITNQLEEIKKGWGEIKDQMEQEIEKKRKQLNEKKIEYTYKADQIKQMRKEISDSLRETKYKEDLIKFMEEEYAKTPKDITRQFYVDRIAETINSVKNEKAQVDSTITDIKDLKEVISKTIESIHTAENEVEDVVFKVF